MTEETDKEVIPVSEDVTESAGEMNEGSEKSSRMVPLEALEAERKRRQDAEANFRLRDEMLRRYEESNKKQEENPEDEEELVSRGELKKFHERLTKDELAVLKREIAEETYKDTKPEAIKLINTHLKEILEKKPWLADSIQSASNRYARAYEIVNDYMPQVVAKKSASTDAKKMIENAKKPGSPVATGKSQQLSGSDYLKSIAGTKEFKEYRKQLLGK